jgi:peptide deformylase
MRKEELKKEMEYLKSTLTGILLEDIDIQQKIYEIKKMLNPAIVENPELDDDEGCLSCGA